jgi:hypothetical protein
LEGKYARILSWAFLRFALLILPSPLISIDPGKPEQRLRDNARGSAPSNASGGYPEGEW